MCGPAVAALPAIAGVSASTYLPLAIGAGLSYAGSVRSANAADAAASQQIQQKNLGIQKQTAANQRVFDATMMANQSQADIDRKRMADFQAGVNQVNDANTGKDANKNVQEETGKLKGAFKASVERGEQTASSGVEGNTSDSFAEAESKTVEKSGQKAGVLADQMGTIGGIKKLGLTQQNKLGTMNANMAKYGPMARGQAMLDRQRVAMAGLQEPEYNQVVNPNSTSGDIMGALGKAMMMYGGSGMFGKTPGLLGPANTANPYAAGSGMAASNSVWRGY